MKLSLLIVILVTSQFAAAAAALRDSIPLGGEWDFYTDVGEASLAEVKTPPAKIAVPGAWQAQGFGTPGGSIPSSVLGADMTPASYLRHNLTARCLYVRSVAVPAAWQGQRVFLCVRRAYRYVDAMVNGKKVGDYEGFSSPFEFEITDAVKVGADNQIVIGVDNRAREGRDTVGMANYFTNTGGFGGPVTLEARPPDWIQDVFAMPKIAAAQAQLRVTLQSSGAAWTPGWSVAAEIAPWDAAGKAMAPAGKAEADLAAGGAKEMTLDLPVVLSPMRLWTQDDPFLYVATVRLLHRGKIVDVRTVRFGMREITADGTRLRLNGQPLYLAGYGDDATEPLTGMPPWDKEVYLKRLRMMRSYGFNFVRHHSHFPHDEYLDAADETGMLVQGEAGMAYVKFWPKAHDLFTKEWPHLITAFRNHPSVWAWCTGNEFFINQLPKRSTDGSAVDLGQPLRSGPLATAPVVENGVYGPAGKFPVETFKQAHYYRDIEALVDGRTHSLMHEAAPADVTKDGPHELGLKFTSERDGTVTRVRYFRVAEETGEHTGHLWDKDGRDLANVRFEKETATGWQEAVFASPVPVKANEVYVISVNANTAYASTKPQKAEFTREDALALLEESYHVAKKLDPTRLIHASDGGDAQPWTDVLSSGGGDKPSLFHEYGNYTCSLPDFTLIPRLTGVIRPLTYERAEAFVKKNGLEESYSRYYRSSMAMRADAQKHYLEGARTDTGKAGYSFWLGIDFPESPEGCWDEGFLNELWEPKPGLTENLSKQSGPTVLLLSAGQDARTFYHDAPPKVSLRVSHFGAGVLERGRIVWRLRDGTEPVASGELAPTRCAPGGLTPLGEIAIPARAAAIAPAFLTLECELREGDRRIATNSWELYAYPRRAPAAALPGVFSEAGPLPGATELKPTDPLPPGLRVLITPALKRARHGELVRTGKAAVLLLGPGGFKQIEKNDRYFLNGYGGAYGGIIEDHPMFAHIPHEGRLHLGLRQPIAGGRALEAEAMPAFLRDGSIVRGLGLSDWIATEKNLQRSAFVCETVSDRALHFVLCNFDLRSDEPACRFILAQTLDYLLSGKPAPSATHCTTAELETLLR